MARYAIVSPQNVVENIVEWDGKLSTWQPPTGFAAVPAGNARMGDLYDAGNFTTPVVVEKPPPQSEIDALLDFLVTEKVITRAKADAHKARPK